MKETGSYKVLLLTAEFPPQIGGIATLTSQLASELHGKNYEGREFLVRVVTSVGGEEDFDFPVTRTPGFLNIKLLKIFPLLLATLSVCIREKPDKILIGKWTHEAFVAFLVSRLLRIPYVTITHGSEVLKFKDNGLIEPLLRKLLSGGESVVAVSNYTKSLLTDLGVSDVRVIHNGLNLDSYNLEVPVADFREKLELDGKTVLLTVSRLVERKGHDMTLEALAEVVPDHLDLIYLIAGDGDYREKLQNRVRELGLEDHVKFLGFVDGENLDKIYRVSDIFIMPNRIAEDSSDVEGFGLSFLEANLFGLPVIGGDSGGAVDAIISGTTGYLVDPEDPGEIGRRMTELVEDKELRDSLGGQGRNRVLEELNSEIQAERFAGVLCP